MIARAACAHVTPGLSPREIASLLTIRVLVSRSRGWFVHFDIGYMLGKGAGEATGYAAIQGRSLAPLRISGPVRPGLVESSK